MTKAMLDEALVTLGSPRHEESRMDSAEMRLSDFLLLQKSPTCIADLLKCILIKTTGFAVQPSAIQ